jgi:hypothetical protein
MKRNFEVIWGKIKVTNSMELSSFEKPALAQSHQISSTAWRPKIMHRHELLNCIIINLYYLLNLRSRYTDSLRSRRPRGRNSSPGRGMNFALSASSRPILGPIQPPIQRVPDTLSRGVKRLGLEADHSPPATAEVKNTIHPLPHKSSWRSA